MGAGHRTRARWYVTAKPGGGTDDVPPPNPMTDRLRGLDGRRELGRVAVAVGGGGRHQLEPGQVDAGQQDVEVGRPAGVGRDVAAAEEHLALGVRVAERGRVVEELGPERAARLALEDADDARAR